LISRQSADRNDLMAIVRRADQAGWTLTPDLADWTTAANVMASYGRRYGRVEPRDHLADVLFVICAGRVRGEIVTTNLRDLNRWATVARRRGVDIGVSAAG
jgi:hypothetical protein